VTASCCPQINECYGDRGCKLVLECIFGHCGRELGNELLRDERTGFRADPCADGGRAPGDVAFQGCIADCINDFGGVQAGFGSACRAFGVYKCAAAARCGSECVVQPDAGGDGASPADASFDASSDASDAADAPKD
jgi:hypothetical protein